MLIPETFFSQMRPFSLRMSNNEISKLKYAEERGLMPYFSVDVQRRTGERRVEKTMEVEGNQGTRWNPLKRRGMTLGMRRYFREWKVRFIEIN